MSRSSELFPCSGINEMNSAEVAPNRVETVERHSPANPVQPSDREGVFFNIVSFVLYQAGWVTCVGGAAAGLPGVGTIMALALLGLHLALLPDGGRQLKLMGIAGLLGLTIDTLQLNLGVFTFPFGSFAGRLAPPWLVVLWMQFAAALPFSLSWLSGRYALAAVLGLVGGPAAFWAGERMGAVVLATPRLSSYAILGAFWCLGLPTLVAVADRVKLRSRGRLSTHGARSGAVGDPSSATAAISLLVPPKWRQWARRGRCECTALGR